MRADITDRWDHPIVSDPDGPEYLRPRESAQEVVLVEHDPRWELAYAREESRIREAVREARVELHHVGSTSVAGLVAKPILDILLLVRDSTDEASYAPALQEAGYDFHLREPHWHQHRLFKQGTSHSDAAGGPAGDGMKVNLHVFTVGSSEAGRMLVFRDWLRTHPADRDLYQRTKRDLAGRRWQFVQEYADAKTAVVTEILQRASLG